MKINFLGDSITEGVGASCYEKCYVKLVSDLLGCEVNNYGISGTRIARQSKPSKPLSFDLDFQLRVEIIDKTADFTVVFGGINDFGHGDAHIGVFEEKNPYTFYGGLRILIEKLIERFGKEKIVFILPLGMRGDDRFCGIGSLKSNATMDDYIEVMKKVLDTYGVAYMDLYHKLPLPEQDGGNEYFADFVHPNDKGHEWLAKQVAEYFKL